MANNYNTMANYIVSKYIERISGKDLGEIFVDDAPSKRVMVGMLSEDRVEAKLEEGYVENANTRFDSIPSISISFYVKKRVGYSSCYSYRFIVLCGTAGLRKNSSVYA